VPVVASDHPLAQIEGPLGRDVLEQYIQLILTDRTPLTAGFTGGIISPRNWRFADLHTRLDYLLGGFGWCFMPIHMVRDEIAAGRLKTLSLREHVGRAFSVHVVQQRGRSPGKAARWLIEDMRTRVRGCAEPLAQIARELQLTE
jgi:DNA-binding transcriptional LysR family regulator